MNDDLEARVKAILERIGFEASLDGLDAIEGFVEALEKAGYRIVPPEQLP